MLPWAVVDAVLVATASGLLVWAGLRKLAGGDPPAGLPAWMALPFAAGEVAAGLAGLCLSGPAAPALVAVLYLLFSAVVGRALLRGSAAGCGCLGGDERPDRVHLAIDLIAAAAAAAAAANPVPTLLQQVAAATPDAAALAVIVACAVACTALALAHLHRSLGSYRRGA